MALARMPGRGFDALMHFEEAIRISPDFIGAHVNLAKLLAVTPGRLPDAIRELKAALQLHPDPALRRALERLETLERASHRDRR